MELRDKLESVQSDDLLWSHVWSCARCSTLAMALRPELAMPRSNDVPLEVAVVDRSVYQDRQPLRRGGMYQTWLATDRRLGRRVVLKEPPKGERATATLATLEACLRREAHILAQLQHPSIVRLLEAGEFKRGGVFYAMEYLSGPTLQERAQEGSLEERIALLPAFMGVVHAVAYAHSKGVIHRDITPRNIIMREGAAVLIDWTTAKRVRSSSLQDTGLDAAALPTFERSDHTIPAWGTPGYTAPERASGGHDERVDIFSLGAVLHYLLSGECPYEGDSAEAIMANVVAGRRRPLRDCPAPLAAIIARAMEAAPEKRFHSVEAFAEELRRFQAGELVRAHHYSLYERLVLSHRFRSALVGFALISLVGAVLYLKHQRDDARTQRDEAAATNVTLGVQVEMLTQQKEVAKQQAHSADEKAKEAALKLGKANAAVFIAQRDEERANKRAQVALRAASRDKSLSEESRKKMEVAIAEMDRAESARRLAESARAAAERESDEATATATKANERANAALAEERAARGESDALSAQLAAARSKISALEEALAQQRVAQERTVAELAALRAANAGPAPSSQLMPTVVSSQAQASSQAAPPVAPESSGQASPVIPSPAAVQPAVVAPTAPLSQTQPQVQPPTEAQEEPKVGVQPASSEDTDPSQSPATSTEANLAPTKDP